MLKDNWGRIEGLRYKGGKLIRKGWYFKTPEGEDICIGDTIKQAHDWLENKYPDKYRGINGSSK